MLLAAVAVLLVPVILAVVGLGYLSVQGSSSPPPVIPAVGGDGLWLGHAWVSGKSTDAQLTALAARIRSTGIRDLFVHDGPLSDDGSLNPKLSPAARWLVSGLHRRLPGVRVQAWLGDLVGAGHLDLDRPATRTRMLASVDQALADGFDGVHFDMEPVASGDAGYLDLLGAAHALTSARHKVLSIAADQISPFPGAVSVAGLVTRSPHYWSAGYFHAITQDVDEVAVMTYDTGMPFGPAYAGFTRLETGLALAQARPGVHVLIGLPAYHTAEPGHTRAETVPAAIRGVRLALGRSSVPRNVGVALYADFSATPGDWSAYRADWAGVPKR